MAISLTVPSNWDNNLVSEIERINTQDDFTVKVGQVYGAVLTNIGDGRMDTPQLQESELRDHIERIHKIGLPFNFLLNAPSMGGVEHVQAHRTYIVDTIKWVEGLGVDMVTISNPFLGELIESYCPRLKLKISTIVDVKTIQSVLLLEHLGPHIDSITLSFNINREFELLKAILDSVSCEIELLANIICLLNCPFQWYHYDLVGSYTKLQRDYQLPFKDYTHLGCDLVRLKNLGEIIRTPWIRPEDIKVYESFGISSIKLAGRTWPTEAIVSMIQAYAQCQYDGNLWDFIAPWIPVQIDNKAIDKNFIDFFTKKNFDCSSYCGKCRFCDEIAVKAVSLKPEAPSYLQDLERRLAARIDRSISPEMSQYSPDAFFTA
jgi:collagenase-like PrtC family protease